MAPQTDSPLSIAASITGILTFFFAFAAGLYAHSIRLANAVDTQGEVSATLEKIEFLETETNMLNNAHLASQMRQPSKKYGAGDFKYFQGLYGESLGRMRRMDRDLRRSALGVTDVAGFGKMSRVKKAAAWMKARDRIFKSIEERKAESTRIFQIQLAMLSAKIDELSYHQNHHNVSCSIVVQELGALQSVGGCRELVPQIPISRNHIAPSSAFSPDGKSAPNLASLSVASVECTSDDISSDYHRMLPSLGKHSDDSATPTTPPSVSPLFREDEVDTGIHS